VEAGYESEGGVWEEILTLGLGWDERGSTTVKTFETKLSGEVVLRGRGNDVVYDTLVCLRHTRPEESRTIVSQRTSYLRRDVCYPCS
jgi:hypothetical protein